jgi:hypothetical protein
VKKEQSTLDADKAEALLFEERRAELAEIVKMERIAVALVVPDPTPEAREAHDRDIEAIALRVAKNFEIDRYQSRVVDVSNPTLAYGYDLQSHRPSGERLASKSKAVPDGVLFNSQTTSGLRQPISATSTGFMSSSIAPPNPSCSAFAIRSGSRSKRAQRSRSMRATSSNRPTRPESFPSRSCVRI